MAEEVAVAVKGKKTGASRRRLGRKRSPMVAVALSQTCGNFNYRVGPYDELDFRDKFKVAGRPARFRRAESLSHSINDCGAAARAVTGTVCAAQAGAV